ncbi:hypothetical protein CUR178_01525 [Leishmania enriettii]|uniref:Transcription factor CBF/NF-Y/archaeal histone domain-containing protein n=1 Tax=Leishmania enriettii TaxID=5663 RepID=A0A836GN94_LEIEN|nr:hypothetical protein CUR178_01525 [Leishmania enriettii]
MSADGDVERATYDDTLGTTLDPDEGEEELASYLVPRLAAYAPSTSRLSSPLSSYGGGDDGAAEKNHAVLLLGQRDDSGSPARDGGERSAAHASEDDTSVGVARHVRDGVPTRSSASAEEEAEAIASTAKDPFLADVDGEDADDGSEEDAYAVDEENEEETDNTDVMAEARSGKNLRHDSDVHSYANAFAHSRVKELLKFEGSSSIISKDATAAACEAVALITRDLVSVAAGEATRRHRKTVVYEDIARVAQLLDRFSFLSDVVPPVASSSSALAAGRSIVVGSNVHSATAAPSTSGGRKRRGEPPVRSRSAHERTGRAALQNDVEATPAATRSATAHARLLGAAAQRAGVHPHPALGLRQATLRF